VTDRAADGGERTWFVGPFMAHAGAATQRALWELEDEDNIPAGIAARHLEVVHLYLAKGESDLLPGLTDHDPSAALPPVRPAEPSPRPAPEVVYRAALAAADGRLRLMLRLAAELGMRRGEVARARADDLERDLFGWTLRVHGKGGKVRTVPLEPGLAAAVRERGPGFLFPGNDHGHLSPHYVGRLVSRAMPDGWSMHKLRHRFGTLAFSVDRDLITVQQLMGHASVETTRRYVKVPADSLRRTVAAVASF
jgi:integrase